MRTVSEDVLEGQYEEPPDYEAAEEDRLLELFRQYEERTPEDNDNV